MRWRRREQEAPLQQAPNLDGTIALDGDFSPYPELTSPEDFVASQGGLLESSQNLWRTTTDLLQLFKDEKIQEAVHQGVEKFFASQPSLVGETSDSDVTRQIGATLLDELSVMWLVNARHMSGRVQGVLGTAKEGNGYLSCIPNATVQRIVTGLPWGVKAKIASGFSNSIYHMANADTAGTKVLNKFLRTFGQDPERVHGFVDLYHDGVADIDPHFAELRKIIATDWHHYDHADSMLRRHVQDYATDPSQHLDAFAAEVVANQSDHAIGRLRAMASFAIIANGVDPVTEAGIRQKIVSSYGRWADVPKEDIDSLFEKYIANRAKQLESAITAIAGRQDPQDIRAHRSYDEVYQYFSTLGLRMPQTRQERRRNAKIHNAHTAADKMPTAKSLATEAASLERKPVERELVLVQAQQGSHARGVPLDVKDLASRFKLPTEGSVLQDMQNVVGYLRNTNRITMQGIKRINKTVRLDGRELGMWRFAPNDCPGLRVNSNNRFWRVVFAIRRNELLLLDILDHSDFDRRY
ncbi:hypothetical protein EYC59_01600 [Candidatus Saccharibacteria bacterium]|nr:MAG: hypothetical protein EYC59_01600 [Candidatus Saccharibacteria bacterium]